MRFRTILFIFICCITMTAYHCSEPNGPSSDDAYFAATGLRKVQITDLPPEEIQLDPFALDTASVSKNELMMTIAYGGGCRTHDFNLYMSGGFLKSNPAQVNLYLRHDGDGDSCEAYLHRDVRFDLTPVADLYEDTFGTREQILVNVFEYFEATPGRKIQVSYHP